MAALMSIVVLVFIAVAFVIIYVAVAAATSTADASRTDVNAWWCAGFCRTSGIWTAQIDSELRIPR